MNATCFVHWNVPFNVAMKTDNSVNVERLAARAIEDFLEGLPTLHLGAVQREGDGHGRDNGVDMQVKAEFAGKPLNLLIEVKASGQPRIVREGAQHLRRYLQKSHIDAVPMVIAPYLSPQARAVCREEKVGYLDFMGNAFVAFDAVYIERAVPGQPEPERRTLRSLYKPKAARILRCLLNDPKRQWRTSDLVDAAKVSAGLVSNVGVRIRELGWAEQSDDGLVLVSPDELLDSWVENYVPPKGEEHRCYTTYHGASFVERLRQNSGKGRIALASFSAAEWLSPFVRHPNHYFYADEQGFASLSETFGLKGAHKGGNVVIVIPEEDGVLDDARMVTEGLIATSPVQTYLDLKHAGDRGQEGADFLRSQLLDWHK